MAGWVYGVKALELDLSFEVPFVHRLRFTQGVFGVDNSCLADLLVPAVVGEKVRVVVVMDRGVASEKLMGEIAGFFEKHTDRFDLRAEVLVVDGGEAVKQDGELYDAVCDLIHQGGICRQSYVVVIGGGAVLDTVGFAAGSVHRGVRLVRLPSTTMGQADSGVGVKFGINHFGKKNFLGGFGVPWGVVCDTDLLKGLPDADWRCGFIEAVKVGLVKDGGLFEAVEAGVGGIVGREMGVSVEVIKRSARVHMEHIVLGGDAFEMTSARPLDFGHWAGHKLEQMTDFQLRHGEGVAMGLGIDVTYCYLKGMIDEGLWLRILRVIDGLGFGLKCEAMGDIEGLLGGLEEFREHLGGRFTLCLIEGVGKGVDVHEIDFELMRQAIVKVGSLDMGMISAR